MHGVDMRKNKKSIEELRRPKKELPRNSPPEYWLRGISTEEETLESWKKLRPRPLKRDEKKLVTYEDEFRIMLEEMGIHMTDEDLVTLMRKYDGDGQGEISYAEFCHAMIPKDYVAKGQSAHRAYNDADTSSFDAAEAEKYLKHMKKQTADREKTRRLNQLFQC